MTKVLIVEDEIIVAEDISDYLQRNGYHVSGIAVSAEECFSIIKTEQPDIILMDIRIQGSIDGINTAIIIHQTTKIPIIFITANTDEATLKKAISAEPHAFISKPFKPHDIKVAIELALNRHNGDAFDILTNFHPMQSVFVKQGSVYKRINISDILYIEADGSYSILHTKENGKCTLTLNLNQVLVQINNSNLKRIHRSYIINIQNVDGFDTNTIFINNQPIPVSKQYQKEVQSTFLKL